VAGDMAQGRHPLVIVRHVTAAAISEEADNHEITSRFLLGRFVAGSFGSQRRGGEDKVRHILSNIVSPVYLNEITVLWSCLLNFMQKG